MRTPSCKDFFDNFMKSQLYQIVDNENYDKVCFTYRATNKLAGSHYKIALNKKMPEELQNFLLCKEFAHIYCRHVSNKQTLDYVFSANKIKAVYDKLVPLFDGQNFEEMYDIFEDYIFNMLRDWEVLTKFFTEEEVRYWDTLYPEECGEVYHMLPQDAGYPEGLTANEYLTLILENPQQWFINQAQAKQKAQQQRQNQNGTQGGCNTNQDSSQEDSNANANNQNHNKEDREKEEQEKKNKQGQNGSNNQQNQNGQNQQDDSNSQQNQNGSNNQQNQNSQNGSKQQSQQGQGSAQQNQEAADSVEEQNWEDAKNGSSSSDENGDEENKENGSGSSSSDENSDEENEENGSGSSNENNGEENEENLPSPEELKEMIKNFVEKMLSDYEKMMETKAEQQRIENSESQGYSRSGNSGENSGNQGTVIGDSVTNWSDFDNLEKEVRDLLINRVQTTTKRDILFNYNRGRFSGDVCVPKYRTQTSFEEVPMTVLLDVSGSISSTDILGFTNIFKNVAQGMDKKCTIVMWDESLRAIYDSKDDIKAVSGGGTDIGAGIEYIKKHIQPADLGNLFVVSDCEDNLNDWNLEGIDMAYLVCWTNKDIIKRWSGSLYDEFMDQWEKVLIRS